MAVPVGPNTRIPDHVCRVRDEWASGGGGGGSSNVNIVSPLPLPVQNAGIVNANIVNYPAPLAVDISSAQSTIPVAVDRPTTLGGFDLSAANAGGAWVRYQRILNRWRGGDPNSHGVWACVRHQNEIGGNVEIRLSIELPSSFFLESNITVGTSPNDQFVAFPAPTIVGAPPEWQAQLLPIFWQSAWLEIRVPAGYSTGDLYLFFTHSVE